METGNEGARRPEVRDALEQANAKPSDPKKK
jgi:hypothetical protein